MRNVNACVIKNRLLRKRHKECGFWQDIVYDSFRIYEIPMCLFLFPSIPTHLQSKSKWCIKQRIQEGCVGLVL